MMMTDDGLDSNNDDEEAALLAELANIRSKRADAKEREEAEAAAEERVQMEKAALTANPLLIVEGCASLGMIKC
jgi:protein CWC15